MKDETPRLPVPTPVLDSTRAAAANENKTYQNMDRVTVLGLVCEKMAERVGLARQEEEDRRSRKEAASIAQDHPGEEEDMEDDEGAQDEREIWQVTHVSEEELETTEGEGVDVIVQLLELPRWDGHRLTTRRRRRTCLDYCLDYCLINFVE